MNRITCHDLTKKYGSKTALDHLNLELDSGKIVGLLGPNGSGKTTLIKLACRLLQPTSGEILINGQKPGKPARPVSPIFRTGTFCLITCASVS